MPNKSFHDINHDIINYEEKKYICEKHNKDFKKYCNDCKINICKSCLNEHESHYTISYDNIILEKEEIKIELNELKESIEIFNYYINSMIRKLNKIKNKMEIFYKIYYSISAF